MLRSRLALLMILTRRSRLRGNPLWRCLHSGGFHGCGVSAFHRRSGRAHRFIAFFGGYNCGFGFDSGGYHYGYGNGYGSGNGNGSDYGNGNGSDYGNSYL